MHVKASFIITFFIKRELHISVDQDELLHRETRMCVWEIGVAVRAHKSSGMVDNRKASVRAEGSFCETLERDGPRHSSLRAILARGACCRRQIPLWWSPRAHNGPLRVRREITRFAFAFPSDVLRDDVEIARPKPQSLPIIWANYKRSERSDIPWISIESVLTYFCVIRHGYINVHLNTSERKMSILFYYALTDCDYHLLKKISG